MSARTNQPTNNTNTADFPSAPPETHQRASEKGAQITQKVDFLSLRRGTPKAWVFNGSEGKALVGRYLALVAGSRVNKSEEKDLICMMIDACGAQTIYLDWDGSSVSKSEAKRYVMGFEIGG